MRLLVEIVLGAAAVFSIIMGVLMAAKEDEAARKQRALDTVNRESPNNGS